MLPTYSKHTLRPSSALLVQVGRFSVPVCVKVSVVLFLFSGTGVSISKQRHTQGPSGTSHRRRQRAAGARSSQEGTEHEGDLTNQSQGWGRWVPEVMPRHAG